jgi:hypothetical protein
MPHSKGVFSLEMLIKNSDLVPQSKNKALDTLDLGMEINKVSNTPNLGKESKAHPNSPPLASWEYEDGKYEATTKTRIKTSPPDQENLGITRPTMTSPSVKEVWMIIRKKKTTPLVPPPMVTRSRS